MTRLEGEVENRNKKSGLTPHPPDCGSRGMVFMNR
jgi:hypothetical protein